MAFIESVMVRLNEESDVSASREFTWREHKATGAEKALPQAGRFFTLWPLGGEMAEWFKAHAWNMLPPLLLALAPLDCPYFSGLFSLLPLAAFSHFGLHKTQTVSDGSIKSNLERIGVALRVEMPKSEESLPRSRIRLGIQIGPRFPQGGNSPLPVRLAAFLW